MYSLTCDTQNIMKKQKKLPDMRSIYLVFIFQIQKHNVSNTQKKSLQFQANAVFLILKNSKLPFQLSQKLASLIASSKDHIWLAPCERQIMHFLHQ